MEIQAYIPAFVTLFVVIDPIGLTPLFMALTKGATPAHRRAIAARAVLVAAGVLLLFGLVGESVLGFLGISIPAFRVAGGLLLFFTAFDMLFGRDGARTSPKPGSTRPTIHRFSPLPPRSSPDPAPLPQ
jgi:multiple antibiotic resistance protein